MPLWSFSLTATDANRWALRLARMVTGRPKVMAFSYCYHGSVDETFVIMGDDGATLPRGGNVGPAVPVSQTTRVAEFNDIASVEAGLAHGDVAVLVMEPALTNIGIVLPEPGFLEAVPRALHEVRDAAADRRDAHDLGGPGRVHRAPGGCSRTSSSSARASAAASRPARTGSRTRSPMQIRAHAEADLVDVGGVGGTLAGNVLSTAAMRATLGEVLTDAAFDHMIALATRFREGVEATLDEFDVPWSIAQLGARAEYRFVRPAPRNGTESAAAHDDDIEEYLHLYLSNRGVLITPFHNMALMCPDTTAADVDLHTVLFREAVADLMAS